MGARPGRVPRFVWRQQPVDIDADDLTTLHTLPFRLQDDKIIVQARVNGGRPQDFILDTGSEETVLSRQTAERQRVRAVTYTLSAGVGEVGLRGLQLAQVKSLDFGTLEVRNLPVLIKNPALRGIPKREGESFSPLSIGMSMRIDYKNRLLTIGRHLPEVEADVTLPMRINRLAMVRGLLNQTHPAYFVVDTGGEVISISSEMASSLPASPFRRIPLRVWGTSGWDREAFLMPDRTWTSTRSSTGTSAGRAEPPRAEHPPGLSARGHRRPQVPRAVPGDDGYGAQRAVARTMTSGQ